MKTACDVLAALARKFAPPSWAFFSEIKSSVGMSSRTRIDGLAVAMWRSLGLEIHAFEIKCSRADFLREIKNGGKSEEIFCYVDRFWIVVPDPEIIRDGELPATWGAMIANGRGLKVASKAPKLDPKPLSRDFVAEILRHDFNRPESEKIQSAHSRGFSEGKQSADHVHEIESRKLKRLEDSLEEFQKASGLSIHEWTNGRALGEAVKSVQSGMHRRLAGDLRAVLTSAQRIVDLAAGEIATLEAAEK